MLTISRYIIHEVHKEFRVIENEQFATGGYYLFANDHFNARRYISAFL